jgi:alkanesulfonate monooxygenase SsuD/methylene tetrahydromethanopterin reductase-like flavin-dependent oxidoreductase (luciferase family)
MPRRTVLIALAALALAACGAMNAGPRYLPPPPPVQPPPPPPPGAIQGHGAFRLAGGRATCAGFSVALMPDLPRYRSRVQALYGSTGRVMETVSEVKARSAKLAASPDTAPIASASCDARGEFTFTNVVSDHYFLIMHVKIRPAQGGHDDYVLLQPVGVQPGQTTVVTLAP